MVFNDRPKLLVVLYVEGFMPNNLILLRMCDYLSLIPSQCSENKIRDTLMSDSCDTTNS